MAEDQEKKVFGTFSPASKYEALLVELGTEGPTEDKSSFVFRILDELIPNLGVFSQLMKLLRDQLFESVYSDQYTGKSEDTEQSSASYIQQVPYFTLAQRIYRGRDERAETLSEQLNTVQKALFDKQVQYENSQERVCDLEKNVQDLKDNIRDLEANLKDRDETITKLNETLDEERASAAQTEHNMNCDIQDLKDDIKDLKSEVKFLDGYKSGYDKLQEAFIEDPGIEALGTKKKKGAVSTRRANVISNIQNSLKLEEQILTVQNAMIEEFDQFLETHKETLSNQMTVEDPTSELFAVQEMEIDQADQQLLLQQDRFRRTIDQVGTELELLGQHKMMLQEQLQTLEENRPSVKRKRAKEKEQRALSSRASNRPGTQESALSAGLDDEDEDDESMDPFIPQERVFSKYAAMMYHSGDGKTYHEFKDAKYCPSCGEKTVFCPHKISQHDKVFVMPPDVTHIKLTRPKVRINLDTMNKYFTPPVLSQEPTERADTQQPLVPEQQPTPMHTPYMEGETPFTPLDTPSLVGESQFPHSVQRLWEDYHSRTMLDRQVPRPLSLERTLSLIGQFAASILWQDEYASEEDGYMSVLDSLYKFLEERYIKPEIMFLSAHDLLTSLVDNAPTNKTIQLFVYVLIGNLDTAVFRYLLLINDFIEQIEWQEMDDFRTFAATVYPFLTDDDLENLQMGYTAFSENKVSKHLVSEYIIYCILKYREPRFLECEAKLLATPGKELERMTEAEFVESSDHILPVVNDHLRRRLFREADAHLRLEGMGGTLPILKLAQITSYLALLQLAPVVRDSILEKVVAAREKESSSSIKTGNIKVSRDLGHPEKMLTLSGARTLAHNMARRARRRAARRQHGYDD